MDSLHVVVIGGGPAGMMAAGRAAELGARVTLLEKNANLGRKLLLTGGGRCNIFHAEYDAHRLVEKFGAKGKSLFSTLAQFDVQATHDFFEAHGLPIMIEDGQRAFPASERAEDVLQTLLRYLKAGNVHLRSNVAVQGLEVKDGKISKVMIKGGEVVADRYIVATGGKSHPETGSTGDGFTWLEKIGHTILQPDPTLVPVRLSDPWAKDVAGISLQNVRLTMMHNGTKHDARTGSMLFTHIGLSGPLVLNMSKDIGELLKKGEVLLSLDLFPSSDLGALDQVLLATFEQGKNRMIRNAIGEIVQPRLGQILLALAGIAGDTPLHRLTREERLTLARLLKDVPLHVAGLLGPEKAIVTGGGVALSEVNFKSMRSKLCDNLFLAGDILDFDRQSGGFSLQICWTTGYVAGSGAAA